MSPVQVTRTVQITPINPAGPEITFGLCGESKYGPGSGGGSNSGWQPIDRPQLVGAMEWLDRPPFTLELPLVIDSGILWNEQFFFRSIEPQCARLESWTDKVPGTNQPPILTVTGPVPGISRQWVLYTFEMGAAIRHPQIGYRSQQIVQVTLYEYNAPITQVGAGPSPAQAALAAQQAASGYQAYLIYTVRAGDTLQNIAARYLNNYSLWPSIAALNNIRDPRNIVAGEQLKIPRS